MENEDFIKYRECLLDTKNSLIGWPITTSACLPFALDNLLWLPAKKEHSHWYIIKPVYKEALIDFSPFGGETLALRMANGLEDSRFSYKVLVAVEDEYSLVEDDSFYAYLDAYLI